MIYKIAAVEVVRYPVLKVTFNDGLSGEYDLTDYIATRAILAPLKDPAYFATVRVGEYGNCFGWNLDNVGHEIDISSSASRIAIESAKVRDLAGRYRDKLAAAAE